jgi:hypothetical protein
LQLLLLVLVAVVEVVEVELLLLVLVAVLLLEASKEAGNDARSSRGSNRFALLFARLK